MHNFVVVKISYYEAFDIYFRGNSCTTFDNGL